MNTANAADICGLARAYAAKGDTVKAKAA